MDSWRLVSFLDAAEFVMFKMILAVSVSLFAAVKWIPRQPDAPATPLQSRFWLEHHPGHEVALKISAECEDELATLQVIGSGGRVMAQLDARSGSPTGLAGLELEFREPELPALLSMWSPGIYGLRAVTVAGTLASGTARFDAELPRATHILEPLEGALVSASDLTVRWVPQPQSDG